MGRKSNTKGKQKRLARKGEQIRISIAKAVVDKANSLEDPLEPLSVFKKYNNNGIECDLYIKRIGDVEESVKEWAFGLTKKNMQYKYEMCSWGWNDSKKKEELMDESAWYLVAHAKEDNKPMGFSHFRFDLDEGMEVLYCYELQLETGIHRKGLGKYMMQALELVAFTNNMKKVILTVLKNNSDSTFFKAINYQLDESSPVDNEEEEYPYEILSKINKKLVTAFDVPMVVHSKANHAPTHHAHPHHCCPGHHHH